MCARESAQRRPSPILTLRLSRGTVAAEFVRHRHPDRMRVELGHETLKRIARSRSYVPARVPVPRSAAARLLALQRTAGNRAVGRMLQRQPTGPTPFDVKKDDAVSATLIMDDPIGVLPLVSFSRGKESEVHVTVPSTVLDSTLLQYSLEGRKFEHVKISTRTFDLELDDVYISSFDTSRAGPDRLVHMALNHRAMTFTPRK